MELRTRNKIDEISSYLKKDKVSTKSITRSQQNSLHLWFRLVADELNDAGFTVNHVLSKKVELSWNERLVKEILWRELQQRLLGKKSTKELEKHMEIDQVWETLNRHLGQEFGIHVAFPVDVEKPTNYQNKVL